MSLDRLLKKIAMISKSSSDKNGTDKKYFVGDELTYVDVVLVSFLLWAKITAPIAWERIENENGGRWAKLIEATKPYLEFN